MRSIVGVGITPPKVLGTPKPASSVMISSTFGAPFGGTTRGAHHDLDCSASFLITPPKAGSGAGSWLGLTVLVALGEPNVPVTCWPEPLPALVGCWAPTAAASRPAASAAMARNRVDVDFISFPCMSSRGRCRHGSRIFATQATRDFISRCGKMH